MTRPLPRRSFLQSEQKATVPPPSLREKSPLGRDDLLANLTNDRGRPFVALEWHGPAFEALDNPDCRELLLWLSRQSGKSQWAAVAAIDGLLRRPGFYAVIVAAGEGQAQAIFERKLRRPFERLIVALGLSKKDFIVTKRSVESISQGSKVEVVATSESTTPGRSVDLLIFDEGRDVPDSVYTALAPSTLAVNGKIVIASTAGRPSGFFHACVTKPTPQTVVLHSTSTENPFADKAQLDFIEQRIALISASARRREIENQFADDEDSFLPSALIDAAVDETLAEWSTFDGPAATGLDLARKRDLATLATVVRTAPRRPEARDHAVVASLAVWDPRRSPTGEVDFGEVREALGALPARFPRLTAVVVDEGAEAGSVLPWARTQAGLALWMQGFAATPERNLEVWSALAARLNARTLSIPNHPRLIAELKARRIESFALGSRFRVVDSDRRLHRDVSLALALAVWALGEAPAEASCAWADAPTPLEIAEPRPLVAMLRGGEAVGERSRFHSRILGGFFRGGAL